MPSKPSESRAHQAPQARRYPTRLLFFSRNGVRRWEHQGSTEHAFHVFVEGVQERQEKGNLPGVPDGVWLGPILILYGNAVDAVRLLPAREDLVAGGDDHSMDPNPVVEAVQEAVQEALQEVALELQRKTSIDGTFRSYVTMAELVGILIDIAGKLKP